MADLGADADETRALAGRLSEASSDLGAQSGALGAAVAGFLTEVRAA
jgi:hypothetical protein